jgi:ABC-2 type transport system ATP-binding protein
MNTLLKVSNLSIKLGKKEILKNISFEVRKGEIVGILGKNGSGKSTLIKAILGLIPYRGKVEFYIDKRKIGYVPQKISLFQDFTIEENFKLFSSAKEKVDKIINLLDLKRFRKKEVKKLSIGYQRLVNIGIALLNPPKLLFLDEPTANLDVKMRKKIISLLKFLRDEGMSIVIVTHLEDEIEELCDRVLVIGGGTMLYFGTLLELREAIKEFYVVKILGDLSGIEYIKFSALKPISLSEKEASFLIHANKFCEGLKELHCVLTHSSPRLIHFKKYGVMYRLEVEDI